MLKTKYFYPLFDIRFAFHQRLEFVSVTSLVLALLWGGAQYLVRAVARPKIGVGWGGLRPMGNTNLDLIK